MIKMILSDMDGTLLDERGNIPPDFDEVMALLKERGVLFVPASGRQYSALLRQLGSYEKELAFIAENGAIAMYKGMEIFSSPMDKEAVLSLLKEALTDDVYVALCGKRCAFLQPKWEPFLDFMVEFFTQNKIVDDFLAKAETEDILKVAFCDCLKGEAEKHLYPRIKAIAGPGIRVVLASNYWVDVLNEGINKGTALKALQKRLGIRKEECIAFGDYLNDLELLDNVGMGFAMANAHPLLLKRAKYVAPANSKNGVMATIRRLIAEKVI